MGRQRSSPEYREAEEWGRESPTCDPRKLLQSHLGMRGTPSGAWLIKWLVQQGPEQLLGQGAALLLLRVVSYINTKTGTAWMGRATLAALAGRHRKTLDTHARALTAPWAFFGEWFPPLFRAHIKGWGQGRRVHWEPLEQGWSAFLELLALYAKAAKAAAHAGRRASLAHEAQEADPG